MSSDNVEGQNEAAENIENNPLMQAVCGSLGAPAGAGGPPDLTDVMGQLGGNAIAVAALGQLLDPNSPLRQACTINPARMCMNVNMIGSFIPRIIEAASKTTRKLNLRLEWKERAGSNKVFVIETFVTSIAVAEAENAGGL